MPWESQFDEQAVRVLVAAADATGLPVAAHAHGAQAVGACVAAGVHAVEHCTSMTADGVDHDPALLRDLAGSRIVVRTTPGLVPGGPPPAPAIATRMHQIVAGLRALRESGVRLVVSTDAGVGPAKPHDTMPYAVLQFGAATEDPAGALRAATSEAADAVGMADTCGRLAHGCAADLLVVRGEALFDLRALLEVQAVYREGQQVAGPSSRPGPPADAQCQHARCAVAS